MMIIKMNQNPVLGVDCTMRAFRLRNASTRMQKIVLLYSDSNVTVLDNKNVVINAIGNKTNINISISTNGKGNIKATSTYEVPNLKCK